MDKIASAESGYVLFRDESPYPDGVLRNFTLAVYDGEKNELYYIEYNS